MFGRSSWSWRSYYSCSSLVEFGNKSNKSCEHISTTRFFLSSHLIHYLLAVWTLSKFYGAFFLFWFGLYRISSCKKYHLSNIGVAIYIAEKLKLVSMILILLLITMASSLVTLLPFQLFKFYSDPIKFVTFG